MFSHLDMYSDVGAQFCLPCPVGYTCTDPTIPPVACTPGHYWSNADGVSNI